MNRTFFASSLFVGALLATSACGDVTLKDLPPGSENGLAIDLVSPGSGPVPGGTTLTILGSGFSGTDVGVIIGGTLATDVSVLDDGSLTVRTPPADGPGVVDVTVFNSFGFGTAAQAFEYSNPLTISRIVPIAGLPAGGNPVTIRGSGFASGMAGNLDLIFGDAPLTDYTIVDDSTITFDAPPGELFTSADVRLANRNGMVERRNAYHYLQPGLLAADGRNGEVGKIYYIDPETAQAYPLLDAPMAITGLATTMDGRIFASEASGAVGVGRRLVEFDISSGTAVDVLSTASPLPDITATSDGKILTHYKSEDAILEIDPATASSTALAVGYECYGCGIAASATGVVVMIPNGTDDIAYTLDEENVPVELKDIVDPVGNAMSALTFYMGNLYGVRKGASFVNAPGGGGGSTLVRIDMDSGAVTSIGPLPLMVDALSVFPMAPPPPEE